MARTGIRLPRFGMDGALEALHRYDLGRSARRAAEAKALKSAESAYCYACYVIKGRWPEAEVVIIADPCWAYYYAKYVIKGRWPRPQSHRTQCGRTITLVTPYTTRTPLRGVADFVRHTIPSSL